jgi:hypothetical protein
MPDVGDEMEKGEPFGEVESVGRSPADLSAQRRRHRHQHRDRGAPADRERGPSARRLAPRVELADETELEDLMDLDEYEEFASGEQEA